MSDALRWTARGVRGAIAAAANRVSPPVVVLAYHRVTRLDADPDQLAVTPERFAQQLEHLRAHLPVQPFDRGARGLRRPGVAITFDDGYADNLHEALPLLERFECPAAFFVTTGPVEHAREFWWDALARCLLGPGARPRTLALGPDEPEWPTATDGQRRACRDALHARLKRLPPDVRDARLEAIHRWAEQPLAPRASHRPLTVDELRRLAASPLATVGAHTVGHPSLAALPAAAQRAELTGARATLERWLGRAVTTASFPFGGRDDWGATSVRLTREAGYARNALNVPGCERRWTDPLRVPRHLVRDWDAAEFGRRLAAFLRT